MGCFFSIVVGAQLKNDINVNNIIKKKKIHDGFFKLHEFTLKHKKHDSSWSRPLTREIFSGAHVATVLPYDKKEKKISYFHINLLNI